MTPRAQHGYRIWVTVFTMLSAWRSVVTWALIFGMLGFCGAGVATLMFGWQYRVTDQWLAVDWGATIGMMTGAAIAYTEFRKRP
jgi:hypothetical protein